MKKFNRILAGGREFGRKQMHPYQMLKMYKSKGFLMSNIPESKYIDIAINENIM